MNACEDEKATLLSSIHKQNHHNELCGSNVSDININNQVPCGCRCCNDCVSSISGNLHFIRHMSLSMIILCFAMFFGFIAIISQSFFFTDLVADVVYNAVMSQLQKTHKNIMTTLMVLKLDHFCTWNICCFIFSFFLHCRTSNEITWNENGIGVFLCNFNITKWLDDYLP